MHFIAFLWNITRHIAWIFSSDSPISKKDLLTNYLRLKIKYILWEKIPNRRQKYAKLFGMNITCADLETVLRLYEEIFIHNVYYFRTKNKRHNKKILIIDCGSHIGISILYFKLLYPKARILSFEPEKNTVEILKKNIENNRFKNISVYNRALYSREGPLVLYFKNGNLASGTGGIHPRKNYSPRMVSATTLSNYVKSRVDFLKIDIEGAETEVISELARANKLKFVEKMTIEYHHHLTNEDKLSKLLSILEKNNYGYLISAYSPSNSHESKIQDVIIYAYRKQ